jgi:hypothetical protein
MIGDLLALAVLLAVAAVLLWGLLSQFADEDQLRQRDAERDELRRVLRAPDLGQSADHEPL